MILNTRSQEEEEKRFGEKRRSSDKMGLRGWEDIMMEMFRRLLLDSGLRIWLGLQIKVLLVIRV